MWSNYSLEYKPGREDVVVDCLLHPPLPVFDQQELKEETVVLVTSNLTFLKADQLRTAHAASPVLQQVTKHVRQRCPCTPKGLDPALLPYYDSKLAEVNGHLI